VTLVAIDDGYDFQVVVVDDAWVFRFARRPGVAQALEQEVELLPKLARALPVEVPRVAHMSHDPPYVTYPLIRGTPLVDEDPESVKAFLTVLHSLDGGSLPLRHPVWIDEYGERCERFARDVLPLLDGDEQGRLVGVIDWSDACVGDPALDYAWLPNEPFSSRL
jgi:aminoglycoside 2''-phosphotransferase